MECVRKTFKENNHKFNAYNTQVEWKRLKGVPKYGICIGFRRSSCLGRALEDEKLF